MSAPRRALTMFGYLSVMELHADATFWLNGLARCAPCAKPEDEAERQRQIAELSAEVRGYEEIIRQGPPPR